MLPGLISKSPQIYADLASGLRTNLSLAQVVKIGIAVSNVPKENIKQAVIGVDDTELSVSYDGQSILLPYMDKVIQTRDSIFGGTSNSTGNNQGNAAPLSVQSGDQPEPVLQPTSNEDIGTELQSEKARIIVLNSTQAPGLANKVKEYLEAANFQVVGTGNSETNYPGIALVDLTGKTHTISFLSQMMKIPESNIFSQSDPGVDADIEVIIGENWQSNISLP
jgi:hypothetical protein